MDSIKRNQPLHKRQGPVVLCIMDGVGIEHQVAEVSAVNAANIPNIRSLIDNNPHNELQASGSYVGLPDGDFGNSEVGHNAFGAGKVIEQGCLLINSSIKSRSIFEQGSTFSQIIDHVNKNNSTLHFLGLFSNGGVHSRLDHLESLIIEASKLVKHIRIHVLFDGRDVGETSGMEYITPFEEFLNKIRNETHIDIQIASGGGRMTTTMDRYNADWSMVERGFNCHVHGISNNRFNTLTEAYQTLRETTKHIDQDLPEFVLVDENNNPKGLIKENDALILYNFRGDRAIEISQAFDLPDEQFKYFDRKLPKNIFYAGMMQYDGDLHIPKHFLVSPPVIKNVLQEYISQNNLRTLAISETQKYGHVTYFFNGNRSGKINDQLETYMEIPSDVISFDKKPAMKCKEITDVVVDAINSGKYDHIRLNFPNGDMVGHTGVFDAVVQSLEAMDVQIGRIVEAVKQTNGVLILTADHGNADQMYETKKGKLVIKNGHKCVRTAHTVNPVPIVIYDPSYSQYKDYKPEIESGLSITSIAATVLKFLGIQVPEEYNKPLDITAQEELYEIMKITVNNEYYAPELLNYQNGIIQKIQRYLDQVSQINKNNQKLSSQLITLQEQRLKNLLSIYNKVRINKIIDQVIVQDDNLSENERIFYQQYINMVKNQIKAEFDQQIDPQSPLYEQKQQFIDDVFKQGNLTNINRFVKVKFLQEVTIMNQKVQQGDCGVFPYYIIKDCFKENQCILIGKDWTL